MKYKVSVIKKIAFLVMTMALAVTMVACQAAAPGKPGETGEPGEAGGVPPRSIEDIADVSLKLAGPMATKAIVVTNNFNDPDAKAGDSLDLSAKSSDETIVTVATSGMTVTVTAVALGEANVTVTVTDKDSLTAKDTFKVTVAASIAPEIIETLPDIWLGTDRMSETIDLADHFFHSSEITYSVRSADDLVATATIEGSVLTVTSKDTGNIRMVVTATADGLPTLDGFQVYVGDHPVARPYDMGEIDDIELTVGASQEVDVVDNFADPNDQELEFSAASSNDAFATVAVDGSMVTVTAVAAGTATISVSAEDEDGLESEALSFDVTVTAADDSDDPDPVTLDDVSEDVTLTAEKMMWEGPLPTGYSLMSDDPTIASVAAVAAASTTDNVWMITAKAMGDTTVQVLDTEGDSRKEIAVMVTVTVEANCQSPVTLDVNKSQDCTLSPGQTMESGDSTKVHVGVKALSTDNEWTITALAKGSGIIVFINNASGVTDAEITVNVNNQKPIRVDEYPKTRIDVMDAGVPANALYSKTHGFEDDLTISYFTDPDDDPGPPMLKYKAESDAGTVLFKTDTEGYLVFETEDPDNGSILLDLLAPTDDFSLVIRAYDDEPSMAEAPITIRFNPASPRGGRIYNVDQESDGDLVPDQKIGNRIGVDHTITFTARTVAFPSDYDPAVDVEGGFVFAAEHVKTLIDQQKLDKRDYSNFLAGDSFTTMKPDNPGLGDSYFTVKADRATATALELDVGSAPRAPRFMLKLSGTSDPTITITHYVWADDMDGKGPKEDPGWLHIEERFVLDVVACDSFDKCSKL